MTSMTCPWSTYEQGSISFCETRLCDWIVEPANTWSNLEFIFVGLIILCLIFKNKKYALLGFPLSAIILGIGSFAFHATGIFWGEFADNLGMFLITSLSIIHSLRRLFPWRPGRLLGIFLFLMIGSGVILFHFHSLGIAIFTIQLLIGEFLEIKLFRIRRPGVKYQNALIGVILFGVGFTAWILDKQGTICNPNNHIFNGHAIWHLSLAVLFYFFYKFELQFEENSNYMNH